MSTAMKFTKIAIDQLQLPESGRVTYLDTDPPKAVRRDAVKGLQLVVSHTGTKSFVLCRKLHGRAKKITIGRFPSWTVDKARKRAQSLVNTMNEGMDPIKERRAAKFRGVSVQGAFDDYLEARGHMLKPRTVENYKRALCKHLPDWASKPLMEITGDMVQKKHRELTKHSPSAANSTLKTFRAIYSYGQSVYVDEYERPLLPHNPVHRLSKLKLWNRETRRQTKIRDADLGVWFEGLELLRSMEDEFSITVADYFEFVILTGLRRNEAALLRVEDVDFQEKSFWVRDTKNHTDLQLPMSDRIEVLLKTRCGNRVSGYVFLGYDGEGHMNVARNHQEFVRDHVGFPFKLHDLRRSFVSIAESLDISAYALKTLVNHSKGSDVTAGYVVMDLERLRVPMQRITDHLLHHAIPMNGEAATG